MTLAACSPPAERTDEQLAERVQAGCAESFAELDRRLRPRLFYVLARRLASREDAEDLVQQTLLRVFEKIDLYDPRQRLSPWVFTIALRLTAEHVRRKSFPTQQDATPTSDHVDTTAGPAELASRREIRDQLWTIADRVLKPEQWTALWLFYGEGHSVKEVAQSLGRTKTSTSVLLFRARRTLLPYLEKLTDAKPSWEEPRLADDNAIPTLLVGQCGGTD